MRKASQIPVQVLPRLHSAQPDSHYAPVAHAHVDDRGRVRRRQASSGVGRGRWGRCRQALAWGVTVKNLLNAEDIATNDDVSMPNS